MKRLIFLTVLSLVALVSPAAASADELGTAVEAVVHSDLGEAVGADVEELIEDWERVREEAGPAPATDEASPAWAPAAVFDRGPEPPTGRMVLLVPLVSF